MRYYRVTPRACQPYRARTKGRIERPFFSSKQHFIKGRRFASFADLLADLASFEHCRRSRRPRAAPLPASGQSIVP
ncbi:MAG: hypothetical protein U0821_21120 [Chloroflexota bacterium]